MKTLEMIFFLIFLNFSFVYGESVQKDVKNATEERQNKSANAAVVEKGDVSNGAEASKEEAVTGETASSGAETSKEGPAAVGEAVSNGVETPEKVEKQEKSVAVEKSDEEPLDDQEYNLKLITLEEKINSLKDKIFKSKQKLAILQETVLSGTIAGSSVTIVHRNRVGSLFKLISAVYYLDDVPVFKKVDSPDELNKNEIVVYDGAVIPGPHHVSAYYVFQGKGYGFFSYMKGYSYKIKTGRSFNVEESDLLELAVSPSDRGSVYNLDNRLYVSYDLNKKLFDEPKSVENQEVAVE